MRIRRPWLVGVLLLIPALVFGHDHKADFFAAPSVAKGSTLLGTHGTVSVTLLPLGIPQISILADVSVHKGAEDGDNLTRTTYLFGGRWMHPVSANEHHVPFGQILIGGVHDGLPAPTADRSDVAVAFGGGYDFNPDGRDSRLAARIQFEYVFAKGPTESFPRFSGGVVYRIR